MFATLNTGAKMPVFGLGYTLAYIQNLFRNNRDMMLFHAPTHLLLLLLSLFLVRGYQSQERWSVQLRRHYVLGTLTLTVLIFMGMRLKWAWLCKSVSVKEFVKEKIYSLLQNYGTLLIIVAKFELIPIKLVNF